MRPTIGPQRDTISLAVPAEATNELIGEHWVGVGVDPAYGLFGGSSELRGCRGPRLAIGIPMRVCELMC